MDIGTPCRFEADWGLVCQQFALSLSTRPPVYVKDDDPSGVGACVVCSKRGTLGRCPVCGLLMHYTCVPARLPGRAQQCPRCSAEEDPEVPDQPRMAGLRRHRFAKGALMHPKVGLDVGVDLRRPCSLAEVPTDEEAKQNGFESAQEWWSYSTGGALLTPGQAMTNYGIAEMRLDPPRKTRNATAWAKPG